MTSKLTSIQFPDALNKYYKLKNNYETSIKKSVSKLISSDLTTKEKQEKFSELKKQCIVCRKSGGTIFIQEGNNLIAKCGHIDSPCKLNINLQRAKYIKISNEIFKLNTEINNKKADIIQTKLNFLFGFTQESKTLEVFNQFKSELISEVKQYQLVNEKFISIIDNIPNRDEIKRLNNIISSLIQSFKNLIKQFDETGENQYLKDAGKLYVDHIVTVFKELQKHKYSVQYVYPSHDNTNHLVQETYKSSDLEMIVPGTENKVIAFTV
tara:strand:+ start:2541 stop:3341 length:801 start_codon:yes stop_codon:yes gene_type:complete